MTNTEIVNPPHPGKLELIDEVARRIPGPWRFVDLGGLWAVHGAYAFHALAQPGCVGGTMVDTHPTRTFMDALANAPTLHYVKGNFGDEAVFRELPPFDVVFLFDTLLHQVRPDWDEILRMYASRASHVLIFNQQYLGDRTTRLLELGEDEYFDNVPHDRAHPTYSDLFRKLDHKHPAHERNWRDVHHIWQWGIVDADLASTMASLGFEQVFSRNWGQVLDLKRFENHAFIFSRTSSAVAAPSPAARSTAPDATPKPTSSGLPPLPQLNGLAAIDGGTLLTGKSRAEQLGLLRNCRRALQPGGSLHITLPDDADDRDACIERTRYAGFASVEAGPDNLVLHSADHRFGPEHEPLVTIAIPAFKPAHFAACLDSALAQCYANVEILVCDDSGGSALREIAAGRPRPEHIRLEWISNPNTLGGRANFIQCLARARGEFVKFLCDDDLLEPDCVERMVEAFRRDPDATLVFSRRQRIDANGVALPDDPHTEALALHDCVFQGEALAGAVMALQCNFIGEPTTVMFRRSDLAWIKPHYAAFDGHDDIRVVGDIAAWHNLLSQGEAVYIARPLSRFRIHAGQNQARPEIRDLIATSWAKLEQGSRALGFMQTPHPPVAHREPGTGVWRVNPSLAINRRLLAHATGNDEKPPHSSQFAADVIKRIDGTRAIDVEQASQQTPAPTDQQHRYTAAAALLAQGQIDEGAEALIALASENTSIWEVYADLADFARSRNDDEAALQLMLAALEKSPVAARAALGAARLLTAQGQFEPALAALSSYLRHDPNDGTALELVRHILGQAPELSAVAWTRLLADLRHESAQLRARLEHQQTTLLEIRADATRRMTPTPPNPEPGGQ